MLGYLIAGIAIGPWGLGFIRDVDEILHFSELGVVFLMFIIGLELNPSKLWELRRSIFGAGAGRVDHRGGAGRVTVPDALRPAGGGDRRRRPAMSSTAMALQLMREKGMNRNEGGSSASRCCCSGYGGDPGAGADPDSGRRRRHQRRLGEDRAQGGGVRRHADRRSFLLRPLFRYIAASGVREIFTAAALLLVLGSALFMEALGLSMALGTFIAGVLLAESEYRHELEISIEPFKGLLLGLFFISVGMVLNIGVLYTHLAEVLIGVLVLVTVKSGVLYGVSRLFGLRSSVRLQFAGVLSRAVSSPSCCFRRRAPKGAAAGSTLFAAGGGDAVDDDHAAADAGHRPHFGAPL